MINRCRHRRGGPNGLMLACELSLAGVRAARPGAPAGPSTEPRANGLVGQVVRMLDRRGLYERLTGGADHLNPPRPSCSARCRLDLSVLEDNPLYVLPVPQPVSSRCWRSAPPSSAWRSAAGTS